MVLAGGFVTSIILLVVLMAAFIFKRERRRRGEIQTGSVYEIAFWLSAAMILFVAALGAKAAIGEVSKAMKSKPAEVQQQED